MINSYATLQEFKNYLLPRGNGAYISTDTTDDTVIENLLESASRWMDDQCHRTFYPRYETRLFDVPVYQNSPRILFLDDDLLEVVKITNGDLTEVTTDVYYLMPTNLSPHYAVRIIGPASIFWIFNGKGSIEKVISVNALWGFRTRYEQRAWAAIDALAAAITNTTSLTFTITNNKVRAGQIIRIGTELMNVTSVATTGTGGVGDPYVYTVTVSLRGDNGSTAATHLITSPIYLWNVEEPIKQAVLQIAHNMYSIRNGQASSGQYVQTPDGIVVQPSDIPAFAKTVAESHVRPL